jgi:hypothetical protein
VCGGLVLPMGSGTAHDGSPARFLKPGFDLSTAYLWRVEKVLAGAGQLQHAQHPRAWLDHS